MPMPSKRHKKSTRRNQVGVQRACSIVTLEKRAYNESMSVIAACWRLQLTGLSRNEQKAAQRMQVFQVPTFEYVERVVPA